jgi:uncharacterized membrane protein
MSEEERRNDSPESRPEEAVDRLGQDLGDAADSVTRELRDLQDEFVPPAPRAPEPPEEAVTVDAMALPAEEVPAEPVVEAPMVAAPVAPEYRTTGTGTGFTPEGTDDDRLMSMLAWLSMVVLQLPVVSVIQLLSVNTKDRPFQRHHAVTSLVFYGAAIVYEIVATIVFTILTTVTLGCGALCLWVLFFVPHALGLYYAFQAYGGKRVHLKYLSDWAKQQGWL